VFVLGKLFQPSLMFAKPTRVNRGSMVGSWIYPQTLDSVGMACQG